MIDPALTPFIMAFMAAISIGGIAYVFLYPVLSGEKRREKRIGAVRAPVRSQKAVKQDLADKDRTKKLQESLEQIEQRQKQRSKVSLSVRLRRAGLSISTKQFFIMSVMTGVVGFLLGLLAAANILIAMAFGLVFGLGAPRWFVGFAAKRRFKKFTLEFPNAIDVIVRSIKAGLPFADAVMIVAREAAEPVRSEFKEMVDSQTIGVPISDAAERMYQRVPLSEVNFFAITVTIQQQSGGNLAEALGNLSKVLRERKKMKAKIQAVSQEAKSSAMIIGALPFFVAGAVYLTSPDYLQPLFTEPMGNLLLGACAIWMFCGIMIMRKMINFDF